LFFASFKGFNKNGVFSLKSTAITGLGTCYSSESTPPTPKSTYPSSKSTPLTSKRTPPTTLSTFFKLLFLSSRMIPLRKILYSLYWRQKLKDQKARKITADQFKGVRSALKMTQQELADELDLVRASVAKHERGETFPGPGILNLLATRYDVSMDYLIADKGPVFFKKKKPVDIDEDKKTREIQEMIDYMLEVPFFYHKVLGFYHQFKYDHPDLSVSKEKEEKE
jgi:transcriptional regulator with XRE-family HTH domain